MNSLKNDPNSKVDKELIESIPKGILKSPFFKEMIRDAKEKHETHVKIQERLTQNKNNVE